MASRKLAQDATGEGFDRKGTMAQKDYINYLAAEVLNEGKVVCFGSTMV
jgi:hypothetical protein